MLFIKRKHSFCSRVKFSIFVYCMSLILLFQCGQMVLNLLGFHTGGDLLSSLQIPTPVVGCSGSDTSTLWIFEWTYL